MRDLSEICPHIIDRIHKKTPRSKIAVILPTYNNQEVINTIKKIKDQTIDVDVVIIDNNEGYKIYNSITKTFPDVTIIKPKYNLGSSGSQYIGGLYAYLDRYEYIIFSDDDAQPIDRDLIEQLVSMCNETTVTVPAHTYSKNLVTLKMVTQSPFHYICASRTLLKKIGLPQFDLFLKGDDYEFTTRISFVAKIKQISKSYYHPLKPEINNVSSYYFFRNYLIITKKLSKLFPVGSIFFTTLSWGLLSLSTSLMTKTIKPVQDTYFGAIKDAFRLKLGKTKRKFSKVPILKIENLESNKEYIVYYKDKRVFNRFLSFHRKPDLESLSDESSILGVIKAFLKVLKSNRELLIIEPLTPHMGLIILAANKVSYSYADKRISDKKFVIKDTNTLKKIIDLALFFLFAIFLILPISFLSTLYHRLIFKYEPQNEDPCNFLKYMKGAHNGE